MTPEAKLKKLQEILKMMDDSVTRDEFVKSFETATKLIIDSMKKLTARVDEDVQKKVTEMVSRFDELKGATDTEFTTRRTDLEGRMATLLKEHHDSMNFLRDKVRALKNGKDGKDGKDGATGPRGPAGSPDSAREIRDKLESLEGDNRLDKSAIKGLDELERRVETRTGGGTSAIGVAYAFKYIAHTEEPTGLINGSNTTYTVKNNIFWVAGFTLNGEQIAQIPNFTYSGRTITFSSALPAAYADKDFEIKYIGV